MKLRCFRQ